jgi:hypothetical protein
MKIQKKTTKKMKIQKIKNSIYKRIVTLSENNAPE